MSCSDVSTNVRENTNSVVNGCYRCGTHELEMTYVQRQTQPEPVVTIQYNTIQYNTIQYNTIQYNTIQYNTIQYNTIQYNTIQYNNCIPDSSVYMK